MSQDREQRTIRAMMEIFCHAHHDQKKGLCDDCQDLHDYAMARLGKCPFGPDKPVCAKCPIHCYRPDKRQQIRDVMKFSGPRMALRHPGLAVTHMLQKRKPVPERRSGEKAAEDDDESNCAGCDGPGCDGPGCDETQD